jgi:hypothetical protein
MSNSLFFSLLLISTKESTLVGVGLFQGMIKYSGVFTPRSDLSTLINLLKKPSGP